MNRHVYGDDGFTLVELMVVVLIIGILVAIGVPVFNSAEANAERKACFGNERTIEGAYQTYRADADESGTLGTFTDYASVMVALTPKYVKASPLCTTGGTYSLASANPTATITVVCSASGHGTHP